MSRHHGHLRSFPPYVGGDDDEIEGWQAECVCGWKGRETPHVSVANGELVKHLNGALVLAAGELQVAREIEGDLRREWWLNHGHSYYMLYGDDGEMQCKECPADFKRQPLVELRLAVLAARARFASEHPPSSA